MASERPHLLLKTVVLPCVCLAGGGGGVALTRRPLGDKCEEPTEPQPKMRQGAELWASRVPERDRPGRRGSGEVAECRGGAG